MPSVTYPQMPARVICANSGKAGFRIFSARSSRSPSSCFNGVDWREVDQVDGAKIVAGRDARAADHNANMVLPRQ